MLSRFVLQHGQNIARRIFEPGDLGASVPVNAFFIRPHLPFVFLKTYTGFHQLVDGSLNIIHEKIEHRKSRGLMVRFGINEYVGVTWMKLQPFGRFGDFQDTLLVLNIRLPPML